jgi:HAD superfamily hydrolase (TIGR01484 family)
MRYRALACDYDGTLATHGRVGKETLAALERLRASGRHLILVTGRELEDLLSIFSHARLFEWVVAENGALLYQPSTREEKVLGDRPPERFVQLLRDRGVQPLSAGRVIVATWQPHETAVLEVIAELGLELQVIFNKGAVMVLPPGVNKATGLAAALRERGLSPHNVVGIGDAENDHAFLSLCECAVAVANALPALKERADFVTRADHGAGVGELIDELIASDLREREDRLTRHHLLLGTRANHKPEHIRPYGVNLLIAGPSGSGKSSVATSILERLIEHQYQFCIIDPEGDYETFERAVALGSYQRVPATDEVVQLLTSPEGNAVVNLLGVPLADRPSFFMGLLSRLQEMRTRLARPHWLIVDEAHHLLPASWVPGALALPQVLDRLALVTVHPNQLAPAVLSSVGIIIAVGLCPETTLGQFCAVLNERPPDMADLATQAGEVVVWARHAGEAPFRLRVPPSRTERRRHIRKYAEGELPPDRSFYFQGPEGKLNLRAQNLFTFLQLAEGVDDATWLYHLQRGDYSAWFREKIKDQSLAAAAAEVESMPHVSAAESRAILKAAIEQHYTLPAWLPKPGAGTG